MHTQIIGQPETGKTTIAKIMAHQSNRPVLVVDPFSDDWGKNAKIFNTVDELLVAAKKQTNCLLIVDESALSFDRYDPQQFWIAKASRHNGHSAIFIGQNIVDTPKGIRSQCTQFFIFTTTRTDAKFLADEFDNDILLNVTRLDVGQFYRILSKGGHVWRGHIQFGEGKSPYKIILDGEEKRKTVATSIDKGKAKR